MLEIPQKFLMDNLISCNQERIDPKFELRLTDFVNDNKNLFYSRIREGKVRDIHGDLYLKNIFIINNRFYMYDRLEFNDS
jgi:aminoglycoside phosphotransferase family enzyme